MYYGVLNDKGVQGNGERKVGNAWKPVHDHLHAGENPSQCTFMAEVSLSWTRSMEQNVMFLISVCFFVSAWAKKAQL